MTHLVLLFYFVALSVGFVSLGISIHLYVEHRPGTLRYFILFSISLLTALFSLFIRTYGGTQPFFGDLYLIAMSMGNLLYVAVCPYLFHSLVGMELSRRRKIFFTALDVALGGSAVLYIVVRAELVLFTILIPSLFLMLCYGILLILLNLKNVADAALRRSLRILAIVSALFLPLLYVDSMFDQIVFLSALKPYGLLTLPAYFIVVNVLCIFFAEARFNHPVFWEDDGVSAFFRSKYDISKREAEIVALMVQGLRNVEMGNRLFVSPKTIENHIYSIYQKTGVKNRVQLVNLIRTNASDAKSTH